MRILWYFSIVIILWQKKISFVLCDCRYIKYVNHTLFGHNDAQYDAESAETCAKYCTEDRQHCKSFDYRRDMSMCTLSSSSKQEKSDNFGPSTNTDYYEFICDTETCNYVKGGRSLYPYQHLSLHQQIVVFYDYRLEAAGRLSKLKYKDCKRGNATIGVWRPVSNGRLLKLVGSVDVNMEGLYITHVNIPKTKNIYVQEGDVLGFFYKNNLPARHRGEICTKVHRYSRNSRILVDLDGDPSVVEVTDNKLNNYDRMTASLWATVSCIEDYISTYADARCPEDWEEYQNSCYKFVVGINANATKAAENCRNFQAGAHLVSIETQSEFDYITGRIPNVTVKQNDLFMDTELWWTSGKLASYGDYWYWDNDPDKNSYSQKVRWSKWYPGEPNNDRQREDRLNLLFKKGKWGFNDSYREDKLRSVCEYELSN